MYGVSRQGATVSFYRDGGLFSSVANFSTANISAPTARQNISLMDMGFPAAGTTPGTVDFAAIWSRSLRADEHRAIYENPYILLTPTMIPTHSKQNVR